jgi:hypothetical protein
VAALANCVCATGRARSPHAIFHRPPAWHAHREDQFQARPFPRKRRARHSHVLHAARDVAWQIDARIPGWWPGLSLLNLRVAHPEFTPASSVGAPFAKAGRLCSSSDFSRILVFPRLLPPKNLLAGGQAFDFGFSGICICGPARRSLGVGGCRTLCGGRQRVRSLVLTRTLLAFMRSNPSPPELRLSTPPFFHLAFVIQSARSNRIRLSFPA